MNQLPVPPTPVDWLKDVFPEMLWLCSMVVFHPWGEARDVIVETMQRLLKYRAESGPVLTGTLSSFEVIPSEVRREAIAALREDGLYERAFAPGFAQAMGMYPSAPGRWIVEPLYDDGLRAEPQTAEAHLAGLITKCIDGRSEDSTWAKAAFIARFMLEGRISIPDDMPGIDLFTASRSGMTDGEMALLQSMIRSMFLALWSAATDLTKTPPSGWARTFWQSNFRLFPCRQPGAVIAESIADDEVERLREALVARVTGIADQLAQALTTVDPDLYEPDRYEVLVGLAARAVRIAMSTAANPALWRPETCHALVRAAVESRILLEWLEAEDNAKVYMDYKEYGRGHLKLYKLQLEHHMGDDESAPPAKMM